MNTDPRGDSERHIDTLLRRLDLVAKVRLISGAGCWTTAAEPAIGLRALVLSDGPAGVRGKYWDERDPSLCLPCPTALAATWDESLVVRVSEIVAAEALRKGVHVVLGPTINLHRSPRAGRHFEAFSEDPLLSGRIAAAYVRAVQSYGVAASPKHYVGNDSENDRFTVDVRIDEQALREVYLAPFEATVAAGAWLVMSSYNQVNGMSMTESPLLVDPLKSDWSFDGVVVSDWTAVRSTVASASGGNDLAMPGPSHHWGEKLLDAVHDGRVPEVAIDEKVRRILRLAGRVGALDGVTPDRAAEPTSADCRALLREAAASAFVLARNEGGLLPLERNSLRRVALIGSCAEAPQIQGGGSATVVPQQMSSPLDGLRDALPPSTEIKHATGALISDGLPPLPIEWLVNPATSLRGLRVRMLGADLSELWAEDRVASQFVWSSDDLQGVHTVELRARLEVPFAGVYRIGIMGVGAYCLTIDDTTLVDETVAADGASPLPSRSAEIKLFRGQQAELKLVHRLTPGGLNGLAASFILEMQTPTPTDDELLAEATATASGADVAIVVVGTSPRSESEGSDRRSLTLPGRQNDLVRAVVRANPRTVVVINSGAPVAMPWHAEVPATLICWFPGQEFGDALADVLLGLQEPGGRLPTTWGAAESDVPILDTDADDGRLHYREGLNIGYRAWAASGKDPTYYFGHGLGYTTWDYLAIRVVPAKNASGGLTVEVTLTNSGDRTGREVVQVYLERTESSVLRPPLWLAGFTDVTLGVREQTTVRVDIPDRAFQHWSTSSGGWATEPGEFILRAGRSAGDLPLKATVHVES